MGWALVEDYVLPGGSLSQDGLGNRVVRLFPVFYIVPSLTPHFLRDFERIVLEAYEWLLDNYEPGDCIFLFGALDWHMKCTSVVPEGHIGFSRGAFQVRVLSAMIDKVRAVVTSVGSG